MRSVVLGAAIGGICLALVPQRAMASGFALRENSAITNGDADSGIASGAEDLSTITTNPAGMIYFDGLNLSSGVSYVNPDGHFHVASASTNIGPLSLPQSGGDGVNTAVSKFVPSSYILWAPMPDWRIGIGVSVPFGLATQYSSDSAARYQALQSSLTAIDVNPSFAYRVTPWLSVGAGVSFQSVAVRLTNAIDFGTLVPLALAKAGVLPPQLAVALAAAEGGRTANDGKADLAGDSWNAGFDLGVIAEPVPGTRIGVSYRSGIDQDIKGTANFFVPPQYRGILAASGEFSSTGAGSTLSLPDNVLLGLTQQVSPELTLNLTYQWTDWSRFKTLAVAFANPNQPSTVLVENYRNTSFVSAGGSYRWDDRLTLRAGAAYDETPTTDTFRDLRLPDGDRYWIAVGASYVLAPGITLNGSYQHLFFNDGNVSHGLAATPGVVNVVTGLAQTDADIFGTSLSVSF